MQKSSIKKNFFYNFSYQILTVIVPLITTPYIARTLGTENSGIYSYVYSVAYYFVIFSTLGIDNFGNRRCAQVRDNQKELDKTFSNIMAIQWTATFISVCLYILYIAFFCKDNKILAILEIMYVFSNGFNVNWFFFGLEEMKFTVIRNIIVRITTTVSIFLFVKEQNGLFIYTAIMALGNLISQLSLWPLLKGRVHLRKPVLSEIKVQIKPIIVLFIPVIALSIYRRIDKIMLGILSSYVQVGYYEYADRIIIILSGFITALGTTMLPRVSNLIANGEEDKADRMIYQSIFFVSFMSIGMIFGIMAVIPSFIPVFLGEGYSKVESIIYCLAPALLFMAWGNVFRTQYLIPKAYDNIYAFSIVLGMFINVIGNILLIPELGSNGAALSTTFSEIVVCFVQCFFVRSQFKIKKMILDVIPFLMFGLIMYLFVIKSRKGFGIVDLLVEILVGITIYFILSLIYIKKYKEEIYQEIVIEIKKIRKTLLRKVQNL